MVDYLKDQDEEDRKLLKKLLARVDKLGTVRNNLLHAEWFINFDYKGANEEFTALALKHNSSQNHGAYSLQIPVTRESLNKHMREAAEILVLMNRFAYCMNQKELKVSKMLSKPL